MASVEQFLTGRLKLRVNAVKSAVDQPAHRKFLGFSFTIGPVPKRRIAPPALDRFKERVRDLTRRDCGNSLDTITKDLARYLMRLRHEFAPTIVWIEHDMQLVRDLADRVFVLHYGKRLTEGVPHDVLADPRVIEAYVGMA